ncbi:hypothetical protein [Pedobacter sp. Leaf250]|uniref:hypothetical protein n=1 Tax=Pedobacter sp. Leaf250 TaxID=2876559 RepID=UPI001E44E8F9|nr:hypothetical protein [Pedobacter sp. Leaf250]
MDINNENHYTNHQEGESTSNSPSKEQNRTVAGINDISRAFWDEINNEIASNDLPLWRMWR